jgi:hypothetical protein
MDTATLAEKIATPIGQAGMAYYFCDDAKEAAKALGTSSFVLYGAGRGGVMGDVDPTEVDEAFCFFKEGMIAGLVVQGRAVATPDELADVHLEVAASFARATLASIDSGVLEGFVAAARALAGSLPTGRWPLVDGYLAKRRELDFAAEAYYWVIVLRELRCAVHQEAVFAAGLSPAEACQLDRGGSAFEIHGYADEDRSEETEELLERRAEADRDTAARMAALLEVLSEPQRQALAAGAKAIVAATSSG